MSRVRKVVFVLSLVLFLASTLLWIRSLWFHDAFRYLGPQFPIKDPAFDIPMPGGTMWYASVGMMNGRVLVHIDWDTAPEDGAEVYATLRVAPGGHVLWERYPAQLCTYRHQLNVRVVDLLRPHVLRSYFSGFQYMKTPGAVITIRSGMPAVYFPMLFGIVSTCLGVQWIRFSPAWRRRHGLCVKCGYDLTGNASGGCPECGTTIEQRVNPNGR